MPCGRAIAIAVLGLQAAVLVGARRAGGAIAGGAGAGLAAGSNVLDPFSNVGGSEETKEQVRAVATSFAARAWGEMKQRRCLENGWKVWEVSNPPPGCEDGQIGYAILFAVILFVLKSLCCCCWCFSCCCCRRK
mmetsp:Transcript_85789/g.262492  ORF Transcript_85789/g.262492 Transcript_85789/m.262492 type:complete len:134 (-) Transcript_85789:101-502(-)